MFFKNLLKHIDFTDIIGVIGLILVGFGLWRMFSINVSCIVLGAFFVALSIYGSLPPRNNEKR